MMVPTEYIMFLETFRSWSAAYRVTAKHFLRKLKWIFLRNKQTAVTDWHVDLRDFRKINVFFLCLFYLFMTNDKRNSVSLITRSYLQFLWKVLDSPKTDHSTHCWAQSCQGTEICGNWKSISAGLTLKEN